MASSLDRDTATAAKLANDFAPFARGIREQMSAAILEALTAARNERVGAGEIAAATTALNDIRCALSDADPRHAYEWGTEFGVLEALLARLGGPND